MPRRLPDNRFKGIKIKPQGKTYRLFLGIFPPSEYIEYFRDVLKTFDKQKRNLKNQPVDQIHLTLKFIGSFVSEYSKDTILEQLERHTGNYPIPEIKIDGIQFGFEYQHNPRAILAAIDDSTGLIELADVVHDLIKELGLRDTIRWKEKRANKFHITIARLKDAATRSSGKEIQKLVPEVRIDPPEPFKPEYLDLVVSELTSTGPVYRRLARVKL